MGWGWGASAGGCLLERGCLPRGGCLPGGGCLLRGGSAWGVVCVQGVCIRWFLPRGIGVYTSAL